MENIKLKSIIKLAKAQYPDRLDLINALGNCIDGYWSNPCYYRFVDSRNANQLGSDWQFQDSFRIEQRRGGTIVVDLLKSGKIGGIEFLDLN